MNKPMFIILPLLIIALLTPQLTAAEVKKETPRAAISKRLTEQKLKNCENREAAIQKRSTQLTKMSENMLVVFDRQLQKIETFYTDKVLPTDKMVTNYDTLVADIAVKKSAVQTALVKATTSAATFSCTSDNPKGALTAFHSDMQAVKNALRSEGASLKQLLIAVRTVIQTTLPAQKSPTTTRVK